MTITFQGANDILSKRFPEPNELKRFPFGDLLYSLWSREDEDGKEYREHGPKVLQAMNTLLGKEPGNLIEGGVDYEDEHLLSDTKREIERQFGTFDDSTRALFRVAALYHDIGKYIIKERHPTVGWYTLEYLNPGPSDLPSQKDMLRTLLGDREDYLKLLMIMIRDHDEFGVLSTGEASYPILLRAASSLGNAIDDQKRVISAIMWLNLADMSATPGLKLTAGDVTKTVEDWKWFLDALEYCNRKQRLDDYVIQEASTEDLVVKRICRLLVEASRDVPGRPNAPSRYSELCKSVYHGKLGGEYEEQAVVQLVRGQLETVYHTKSPRIDFASQFTHICKLDYGKRFFARLVEYCEGPPESGEKRVLPKWADKPESTEQLIYAVLAILRRMTSTYSAMTRSEGGPGNLIGVEMKDLTPRNAPEKTAQIIELLIKSHYPGLSWMMSDCLAWYF